MAVARARRPRSARVGRGFYRFQYDITGLVDLERTNLLEVTVSKHSANESVNRAERQGDYWAFGGIYRPVYLAAFPPTVHRAYRG